MLSNYTACVNRVNSLAFSVKSVTNSPFSKSDGIIGILALLRTVLIMAQYVLQEVPGVAKVLPALRNYFRFASPIIIELSEIIFCIPSSLSSDWPFLTKLLYARLLFLRKF